MRIAIDARELGGRATGVGRYLANLLAEWRQLPGAAAHELIELTPGLGNGRGTVWEQVTLPALVRRAQADVLFAPAYTGPVWSPVPMVLTIHDVSFAAHPEWFSWREGTRRRLLTRFAARRAARVLTVSDFSKSEIVRHLGVPADTVDVIYSGVTRMAASDEMREPLVLFVGSVFNRRHVPELSDGFARLASRHPAARLEIVGDNRTHPRVDLEAVIARSGGAAQVRVRSYVADAELASLYARASALVFLSDYEGFGFTPLEALAAGIPAVVLDTPVAREIYGPAAIYLKAPDPALIEAALTRLLFDETERERLLAAAATVLPRYSWTECARRTLQVIVSAR
jgi:glycosyltransferase involved in cell wall biosynthesis